MPVTPLEPIPPEPGTLPIDLTVEGLKLRLDHTRDVNDELLEEYLLAAFQQAQAPWPDGCGRLLLPTPALVNTGTAEAPVYVDTAQPVARTFRPGGRRRIVLPDARHIESVTSGGVAVTAGDATTPGYELLELQGHFVQLSLLEGTYGDVVVTGRFGFAYLHADLTEAIYTLAQRYWHERVALQGDQGTTPEGGAGQTYLRQLPPRVRLAFSSYRLPGAVGGI